MKGRRQRKAEQIFRVVERMGKSMDPDWEKETVPLKKGLWVSVECQRVCNIPAEELESDRNGAAVCFEIYIVSEKEGDIFSASFTYNPYLKSEWPSKPMEEIDYLLRCATDWD